MTKLKSMIQYECMTAIKYIPIFYAIEYSIVVLITLIIGICMGNFENGGTSALEINSVIYVSILGVLGFKEDFKMLIQNGFTRKYIFIATISLFGFTCGIMSLVDTVMGRLLHHFLPRYESLYGAVYGYDNIFANWMWLFTFYLLICGLLYLAVLVVNKIGKTLAVYAGVLLGGAVVLIAAIVRYVLPAEVTGTILEFLMNAMGLMSDGTINHLFPVFTFLVFSCVFGIASYAVLRCTELK